MGVYYVKNNGTKSSGTSTADDWTNLSNCYPNPLTAYGQITGSGDRIILDDESFQLAEQYLNAGGAYSFTIESRSSDNTLCIIDANDAILPALKMTALGTAIVPTIESIGFTASVIHTSTAPVIMQASGIVGDVTFTEAKFSGITIDTGLTGSSNGCLFFSATTARNWLFDSCEWDLITDSSGERPDIMFIPSTDTVTLTSPVIKNIASVTNGAVTGRGLWRIQGDLIATDIDIDGISCSYPDDGAHVGLFHLDNTAGATINVSGGTVDNVTVTNGSVNGLIFNCIREYNISGIVATNISASGSTGENKIGGLCLSITNGDGLVSDCEVSYCSGVFGAGMYWSQGGAGKIRRMNVHHCTGGVANGADIEGIAYYSGGWNNHIIESCLAHNNVSIGDPINGVAIYAQVAGNATAAKILTITGTTIADHVTDATKSAITCFNDNATHSLTANLTNCILENGGINEIVGSEFGGTVALTLDHCYVQGGQAATSGVDTFTNEQTADPLLTSNYRLGKDSPAKGAGKFISWQDRDVRGRRRSVPPSLGAYEPTSGDPADTRKLRTVYQSRI